MDDAKYGVIYFSLGSLIKGETFPKDKLDAFISVLSALPQHVVWKTDTIPGLPNKFMTGTWLPQFDIISKCFYNSLKICKNTVKILLLFKLHF